jgi:restriction system protein
LLAVIELIQSRDTPDGWRINKTPNRMISQIDLSKALEPFIANWPLFLGLFALLIFFKILGSARIKGWSGERAVCNGLAKLDPAIYHVFHDLYLPRPDGQGSTQLDHVIVSQFGIVVIETKNYRGWIFGSEKQAQWTQQIYRQKNRFQNPLHQNDLHVRALMDCLDLSREAFLSVVFFIGNAEFKNPMPPNVLNQGLTRWISQHQEIRLDSSALEKSVSTLDQIHRSTDRKVAARAHVAAISARTPSGKTNPRRR